MNKFFDAQHNYDVSTIAGDVTLSLTQVHRMLAEFRLIPGLNNLFDKLIWRRHPSSHVLHRQNQNCDCSPVRLCLSLHLL